MGLQGGPGKPFQPGRVKVGGRKKGTPNKKKIIRAADLLAEKDINPVEKILELIPHLEPEDAIKSWFDLLSYCEAKPKEVEIEPPAPSELDEALDEADTETLLSLVRKPDEGA